jgi:FkbM family methyltransferase
MKYVRGIWFPDEEQYFVKEKLVLGSPEFAGAGTYQLSKLIACLPYIKNFHHAIDIGAHIGLWSRVLACMFTQLTAFEPIRKHWECFVHNHTSAVGGTQLHQVALGDRTSTITMHSVAFATGNTRVDFDGKRHARPYVKASDVVLDFGDPEEVEMKRLDDIMIGEDGTVDPIDFVKIDCEGYEYFVLKGGERTICTTKPVIIVEQKPGKGAQYGISDTAACKLLESWGAKRAQAIGGDYIYTWS